MSILVRLNLKRKAALFVAAILIAVVTVVTVTLVLTAAPILRQSQLQSAVTVGRQVVKDLRQVMDFGMALGDLDQVPDMIEEILRRNPDLGYLYVTDAAGKLYFRSKRVPADLPGATVALNHPAGVTDEPSPDVAVRLDGEDFHDVAVPLRTADGVFRAAVHLGTRASSVRRHLNALVLRSGITGLLSFLVATFGVTWMVNRHLSAPLEGLSAAARRISDGDIAEPPALARGDEIGQLADGFRAMVGRLSAIVRQSVEISGSLAGAAARLDRMAAGAGDAARRQLDGFDAVADSAAETSDVAGSLAARSRELADLAVASSASVRESSSAVAEIDRHVADIAAGTESVSAATIELSSSVRQVADSAEANAVRAEEARQAAAQIARGVESVSTLAERSREQVARRVIAAAAAGTESVGRTLAGIESIRDEVRATEETMRALRESAGSIGEILGVIDDIADRTNLLALNAAILAAQAGEHGRGFEVVAVEIRKLSSLTSDSTRRIAALIESVQSGAARTAQSLQRVAESVTTGLGLGEQAQESLAAIAASIEESAGIVREIARVTGELARAGEQIAGTVEMFAHSAAEIRGATREEARSSAMISEAIGRMREMTTMVSRATGEQDRGSRHLAETTEQARRIAVEFAAGTAGQLKLAASIAEAMSSLRALAGEHAALVGELGGTAREMSDLSEALRRELAVFHCQKPDRDGQSPAS